MLRDARYLLQSIEDGGAREEQSMDSDMQQNSTAKSMILTSRNTTSYLWPVSTMLWVKLNLDHNNVTAFLGGLNHNELYPLSQLLALMIGAFGLARLFYLKFKD